MIICPYAMSAAFGGVLFGLSLLRPRLHRTRAELKRTRWSAEHDGLTGLPNRTALRRRYEQAAAEQPVTMALLDLNGFKQVNDTWGHQAGDALLRVMARRLAEVCEPPAFVGRLAGDEFLILLPQCAAAEAESSVDAVLAQIAEPMTLDGETASAGIRLCLSAVAGIAAPTPGGCWSEQLEQADIALYRAKKRGRGSVTFSAHLRRPAPTVFSAKVTCTR